MLSREYGSRFLGCTDSLSIVYRAKPLRLLETDGRPFLGRIDVLVDGAGSRSQLQIVLHLFLQQFRITAARRLPRYAHRILIRKNIAGTPSGCDARLDDLRSLTTTDHDDGQPVPNLAFDQGLLIQRDRGDWVDAIANAARTDRTFIKSGDPEAARAHLHRQRADGEAFAAVDDVECDWMAL